MTVKGTIPKCLEEMVRHNHGEPAWSRVRERAGLPRWHSFLTTEDVPDERVKELFGVVASVLGSTVPRVMEDFGMFWGSRYAPDIYGVYYRRATSARELLTSVAQIHRETTSRMPDARPPDFRYEWLDDRTLVMEYRSHRGLAGLMPGLVRGVAAYYDESVSVTRDGDRITVRFETI